MEIKLKYGRIEKELSIPEKAVVSVLNPSPVPVIENLGEAFEKAMDLPIGGGSLETMKTPRSVAIAVSDESRPTPTKLLLPLLLKRLYNTYPELTPEQVVIVIGSGLHPPLDDAGIRRVVPESIAPRCRVVAHDALHSPMTDYGLTSRGTPVIINKELADADLKLVIGNIDPHQFVGFTGGSKGIAIGCGSKRTIEANHALMSDKNSYVANIDGNAVRLDIDEAGDMIGIPFVINVVLDASNRIVKLIAGEPKTVYREGAKTCAYLYGVAIDEKYDIVVASCGGYPKDLNIYQAQKGFAHAALAAKPDGKILVLAQCPQGVGDDVYFDYVKRMQTPEDVLDDFKENGFRMGAHKAFLLSRTLVAFDVAIASDMDQKVLRECHLKKCEPQAMIEMWISEFTGSPRVAVVPKVSSAYFYDK
ncbi:MAG: nickel-dependent lactate racemase [Deltaproteobacteria bacterium]|nr:nickel-dependent lactate racemase [Deltaproteobacteria bacterium]